MFVSATNLYKKNVIKSIAVRSPNKPLNLHTDFCTFPPLHNLPFRIEKERFESMKLKEATVSLGKNLF